MDYSRYRRAGAHVWALAALFLLIQLADFGARLLPGGSAMGVRLGLLALILPFGYAVVLLTLGGWQQRYRLTAVCALAAAGMGVALAHPEGFSARTATAVNIAFFFMGALAEYLECSSHGLVFAFISPGLRRRWGQLWTWYIWTLAAELLGELAVRLLPGAAAAIGLVTGLAVFAQRTGKLVLLPVSARELRRRPRC